MKKSRTTRITLGIIGPCILGSLYMVILGFIGRFLQDKTHVSEIGEYLNIFFIFLFFSTILMGIQSIVYSLIMEFYTSKTNNFYLYVSASTLLGFIAGLSIIQLDTTLGPRMLMIGTLTGLTLGLILYFMHDRKN